MPLRKPSSTSDKREEIKTYRELKLRRNLKTAIHRKRIQAKGIKRVLGDGSSGHPYLEVTTDRYREVRREVQHQLLLAARKAGLNLPLDVLLRQLKPRIEALVYAHFAEETLHEAKQHVHVAALGRALTKQEQTHFAASRAAAEKPSVTCMTTSSANRALNEALGHIEQRQIHNPARYQTIWAELVGSEIAQQTYLDNIDPVTQTAWFRCANSVLSDHLRRKQGLAQKLSKALGLPIRQLCAKF